MIGLQDDEWASVAYQAEKIHLFALIPLSLDYALSSTQFSVIPRYDVQGLGKINVKIDKNKVCGVEEKVETSGLDFTKAIIYTNTVCF